jgi:hypothetical protein
MKCSWPSGISLRIFPTSREKKSVMGKPQEKVAKFQFSLVCARISLEIFCIELSPKCSTISSGSGTYGPGYGMCCKNPAGTLHSFPSLSWNLCGAGSGTSIPLSTASTALKVVSSGVSLSASPFRFPGGFDHRLVRELVVGRQIRTQVRECRRVPTCMKQAQLRQVKKKRQR